MIYIYILYIYIYIYIIIEIAYMLFCSKVEFAYLDI